MLVNPARHPPVKQADGMAFIRWITSPVGQQAIADFKVNGEPLFFPNYRP
jgi:tungstate transport system substrate-binding protein